jgi:hypothetical protein
MQAREGSGEALAQLLKVCRHYLLLMAEHELTPIVDHDFKVAHP